MTLDASTAERVGIEDVAFTAGRSGLTLHLKIPRIRGGLPAAEIQHLHPLVYLFDQSRLMYADLERLVRFLRTVPEEHLGDEGRALLKHFEKFARGEGSAT